MSTPGFARVQTSIGRHGELRGLTLEALQREEGRFGRMFHGLRPARFEESALKALAAKMIAEREAEQTPETEPDDEENTGISAGYTYLGQFIDHDLTFDPVSQLDRQNDPNSLEDFRTPRFDLDSVYGRGPDDQPYLYRDDKFHMLLGDPLTGNASDPGARGVPRNKPEKGERARAILGDPRNDENVIVSQLQAAMIRFHNRMADLMGSAALAAVQEQVRWHYQWVVLQDFLPTIIGKQTRDDILPHIAKGTDPQKDPPRLKFYKHRDRGVMPVEFSVAAYRFGHSMVRPIYRLNLTTDRIVIFTDKPGEQSLVGFDAFPTNLGIDWSLFFKFEDRPTLGKTRIQPAYKIDSSLVNPLGALPGVIASNPSSLAERNLLRGLRLELPSGQAVAKAMGLHPIPDEKLKVGKAIEDDQEKNPLLTKISPTFAKNAPLWYYILAEAQQQFQDNETPIHLGSVGGRIVGEVFVGLMLADRHSFLRKNPQFKPRKDFLSANGEFNMADLLKQAIKA